VSGPKPLIEMVIMEVLRSWGINGFLSHAEESAKLYEKRCTFFISLLEKYLVGKARWTVPRAGMFCWIDLECKDSYTLISEKAIEKGVLLVPGKEFFFQEQVKTRFVRASFSFSSFEDMERGVQRLSELL
jgi:DNA-binding transcriptional MocR family regulator